MAEALQFSTFVWPNNPETYRMKFLRDHELTAADDGNWGTVKGGKRPRTYECEGVFYGKDAYTNFRSLASLFVKGTTDTLTHPKWDAVSAFMTELEVLEEPCENLLRYRVVFMELPE